MGKKSEAERARKAAKAARADAREQAYEAQLAAPEQAVQQAAAELPGPVSAPAGVAGMGSRFAPARRWLDRALGAELCYGPPVVAGDRHVIPVARVRVAGGFGFGDNESARGGGGGGGGGWLEGQPIGFIDVGPEGSQFHAIPDPESRARSIRAGAAAVATLATAFAGVRALRRR